MTRTLMEARVVEVEVKTVTRKRWTRKWTRTATTPKTTSTMGRGTWTRMTTTWTREASTEKCQVWSLTQFNSDDFSQSRIGVEKCVFKKCTIKVFVSCF